MRIADMQLKEGEPARLHHPIVGSVGWHDAEGAGYALYFIKGPEKGQPLVADHVVLFDDKWELLADVQSE